MHVYVLKFSHHRFSLVRAVASLTFDTEWILFLRFSFKKGSSPKIEIPNAFLPGAVLTRGQHQSHSELCLAKLLSNCKTRNEHGEKLYLEHLLNSIDNVNR